MVSGARSTRGSCTVRRMAELPRVSGRRCLRTLERPAAGGELHGLRDAACRHVAVPRDCAQRSTLARRIGSGCVPAVRAVRHRRWLP